jgi:hypothetical protein
MRRREFIALLVGVAAWVLTARTDTADWCVITGEWASRKRRGQYKHFLGKETQ